MRSQRIGRGFESRYLHFFCNSVLLFPILLTENDNPFRACLGRDTSCCRSIIYHQKMIADAAGKALPVGRSHTGIGVYVQLQLVFRREKICIKISNHYVFAWLRAGNKGSLILGRINQGNRLAGVIECSDAHARAQRGIVHNISAGGKDKINHSIQSPDGYNLVAAFAPNGGDAFNNSGNSGIISSRSHKSSSFSFNIDYAFGENSVIIFL